MQTPQYRYRILSSSGGEALADHIDKATENGWELVPAQSVTVVAYVYTQDGQAGDTCWSYTVIMRTLT